MALLLAAETGSTGLHVVEVLSETSACFQVFDNLYTGSVKILTKRDQFWCRGHR